MTESFERDVTRSKRHMTHNIRFRLMYTSLQTWSQRRGDNWHRDRCSGGDRCYNRGDRDPSQTSLVARDHGRLQDWLKLVAAQESAHV